MTDTNPKPRSPVFILTGTYCSRNKGDAAMQITCRDGLRERWPDSEIHIHAPFPALDREFYAPDPVLPSSRRRLIKASLQLPRAAISRMLGRAHRSGDPEIRAFARADLIIDLSGDMLTEDYGPHVAYSHFLPLLLAWVLGRPYVACAQSVGPFKLTRPLARFLLNRAAWVSARDQITMDYLAGLKIKSPLEYTADLAFVLKRADQTRAAEILREESIDLFDKKAPVLGLSLSGIIRKEFSRRGSSGDQVLKDVAAILDDFLDETGQNLLMVGHVTGPSEAKDDRLLLERTRGYLRNPERAALLRGDYQPGELKAIISGCHMFLGARMHANIAALSSGVPVVALSYSHKTPGIMSLLGQSEYVVAARDYFAGELPGKLRGLYRNRERAAKILKEKLPVIQNRSRRNFEKMAEVLAKAEAGSSQGPVNSAKSLNSPKNTREEKS